MEVILSPDLQAKLTRIAHERGTDAQALAREAIERLVDYDDGVDAAVQSTISRDLSTLTRSIDFHRAKAS